ncbi:MAG: hypothetical protein AB1508_14680 [Pseudomonadota bacterium]
MQFEQSFQDAFGFLAEPEIWFRACAIAVLKEAEGAAMLELLDIPDLLGNGRVHERRHTSGPGNGGQRNERPDIAPTFSASGSRSALVGVKDRGLSSRTLSEGTVPKIGTYLDRQRLCQNSRVARANKPRRDAVMAQTRLLAAPSRDRGTLLEDLRPPAHQANLQPPSQPSRRGSPARSGNANDQWIWRALITLAVLLV